MTRSERKQINRLLRELAEESRRDELRERLELMRFDREQRNRKRRLEPANDRYRQRAA